MGSKTTWHICNNGNSGTAYTSIMITTHTEKASKESVGGPLNKSHTIVTGGTYLNLILRQCHGTVQSRLYKQLKSSRQ